eukprot:888293-Prorocentrum_minimum.AAC.1
MVLERPSSSVRYATDRSCELEAYDPGAGDDEGPPSSGVAILCDDCYDGDVRRRTRSVSP